MHNRFKEYLLNNHFSFISFIIFFFWTFFSEKRIREMQEAAKRNRFGFVYDVSGSDYKKEITEASKHAP